MIARHLPSTQHKTAQIPIPWTWHNGEGRSQQIIINLEVSKLLQRKTQSALKASNPTLVLWWHKLLQLSSSTCLLKEPMYIGRQCTESTWGEKYGRPHGIIMIAELEEKKTKAKEPISSPQFLLPLTTEFIHSQQTEDLPWTVFSWWNL